MIFAAFRVRSFRFQWSADLLTSWAFEMETLVLGWYVMVNTGSVLWLTAFGSLQFLGTLAAPMYGVLGDAGLAVLVVAGFVQNVAMIAMTGALLAAAGEGFRGRVMGVRRLAVYGLPLGLVTSGLLIDRIGYPLTMTASAAVGLLFTLLIALRWRASIWQPAYEPR